MDNRNTPHELDEMFPSDREIIHALKTSNPRFARLAAEYHGINRHVHRMETNLEPVADETLETERKKRLRLLDEIAGLIAAQKKV